MHFLELPRELRDAIYTFALCPRGVGGSVRIRAPSRYRGEFEENQKLALFAVCRQIHDEALPLYYSRNVFDLDFSEDLQYLVRGHNAEHIRALSLASTPDLKPHYRRFTSALARLPQLEHLELRIFTDRDLTYFTYGIHNHECLAERLERDHSTRWLMSMSGLSDFRLKWEHGCYHTLYREVYPSTCRICARWLVLRDAIEACLRSEVTQPRAPFGKSPTHLSRMAARSRA